MIVRSYYLLKLEEQKKKQAQQISVRQIELEDVKENLEESMLKMIVYLVKYVLEKLN